MDLKIEVFSHKNEKYLRTALNLRFEIYTEDLKIDKFQEFDGLDSEATHYLVFVDMLPVGVCRWRKAQNNIIIDRFGIKKEYRGKGYGFLLLKYVVDELIISKFDIQILTIEKGIRFLNVLGFKDIIEEIELSGIKLVKLLLDKNHKTNG